MAGGWFNDLNVHEQIENTINDSIALVRQNITTGESLHHCDECDSKIPEGRRKAVPGVKYCIECQPFFDKESTLTMYNRRGSTDSQMR